MVPGSWCSRLRSSSTTCISARETSRAYSRTARPMCVRAVNHGRFLCRRSIGGRRLRRLGGTANERSGKGFLGAPRLRKWQPDLCPQANFGSLVTNRGADVVPSTPTPLVLAQLLPAIQSFNGYQSHRNKGTPRGLTHHCQVGQSLPRRGFLICGTHATNADSTGPAPRGPSAFIGATCWPLLGGVGNCTAE
jgi:hypothetical protein